MSIEEEWHTASHDESKFYTRRWIADSPRTKIVFVHGFMEHVERYDFFFTSLAQAGIETFAYDQRGFGRTAKENGTQGITTTSDQLKDLDYFIQREARATNHKLFLFGHSMGGAVVLQYATQSPALPGLASLAGVISSAPLIDQADAVKAPRLMIHAGSWIGHLLPSLQMNVGVASKDISRDPEVQAKYAVDPLCPPIGSYKGVADMLLGGPRLLQDGYKRFPQTLPLLLYHGTADKVTSFASSQEFESKIKANDKRFVALDGYYHEPHNEPGDDKTVIVKLVQEWILARC